MPLEQIGLSSNALSGTGEGSSSHTISGIGHGGVSSFHSSNSDGVRRAASLDTAARRPRHFGPLQQQQTEKDANVSPKSLGQYSGRFKALWSDNEDERDNEHDEALGSRTEADDLYSEAPEAPDMTLLKLSGMGGVQRSGSWGRASSLAAPGDSSGPKSLPRSQFRSSLSMSPEDVSADADQADDPTSRAFRWGEPVAQHEEAVRRGAKRLPFGSPLTPSDVPSSGSRTSTASSSVPAQSLRSASTRNSASSASGSSSAASSSRQRFYDVGDASSLSTQSNAGVEETRSETATSTTAESDATVEPSDARHRALSEDDDSDDDYNYTARAASQVGPSVQRICSIGRGFNTRLQREDSVQELHTQESPVASAAAGGDSLSDSISTTIQISDADETIVSLNPGRGTHTEPFSLPRNDKPGMSASPDLGSYPTSPLSWSAAAQAPASPDQTRPDLVPPEPRRHAGSYALRSQSALSSGAFGHFASGGRGRAAAREDAARLAMLAGRDSLQLDADVASQRGGSPPARTNEVRRRSSSNARAPSPELDSFLSRVGSWFRDEEQKSKRTLTKNSDRKSADSDRNVNQSPRTLPPQALQDKLATGSSSYSVASSGDMADSVHSSDPHLASPTLSATSQSGRPSMTRSATHGIGTNVLRTPTTEEWSRFLLKQGITPAIIAQSASQRVGNRSRSNTGKSAVLKRESEGHSPQSPSQEAEQTVLAHDSRDVTVTDGAQGGFSQSVLRSPHPRSARRQPRMSALSIASSVRGDELPLVREHSASDADASHDQAEAGASRPEEGREDDTMQYTTSEDEEADSSDSSVDERMRALHEAISRPPSRLGTPTESETFGDKFGNLGAGRVAYDAEPSRWPLRETAPAMMGYPIPPSGEQRSITDFVITSDIGRGAYGLVKKARIKDAQTGEAVGPEFCIKYIIKSRILADCWRRHKVLGPIPVEIHVLDQLRRLSHHVPSKPPPWSAEKLLGVHSQMSDIVYKQSDDGVLTVGHPALCMMLDFFEDHEFYYMVMPCFGRGQDLFDYVESQPHGLSTLQVRSILGQLADGLKFLHANNIVHRDVKDENVILDGEGHIQLIDFGSAAHINPRATGSSVSSAAASRRLFDTFSGTLDYAAAEILRGEKYGGKEQDVWALGVVGYVLLCGDCPFWNGEEAMNGLRPGSRANTVLIDRCRPLTPVEAEACGADLQGMSQDGSDAQRIDHYAEDDAFVGHAVARQGGAASKVAASNDSAASASDAERRRRDLAGQRDGGGCLADAADLIALCLDLNPASRPSMEQITRHRFLVGASGWTSEVRSHQLQP